MRSKGPFLPWGNNRIRLLQAPKQSLLCLRTWDGRGQLGVTLASSWPLTAWVGPVLQLLCGPLSSMVSDVFPAVPVQGHRSGWPWKGCTSEQRRGWLLILAVTAISPVGHSVSWGLDFQINISFG